MGSVAIDVLPSHLEVMTPGRTTQVHHGDGIRVQHISHLPTTRRAAWYRFRQDIRNVEAKLTEFCRGLNHYSMLVNTRMLPRPTKASSTCYLEYGRLI